MFVFHKELDWRAVFDFGTPIKCYLYAGEYVMDAAFTNNLWALFLVQMNWHTSKAMQSRVEMNDEYIALDCAL
jgi:hypothetical protein